MFYKGNIEQIKKVIVSDPSYKEGVWCRYESNKFDPRAHWRVQMAVNEVSGNGVDFAMLLTSNALIGKGCVLNKDGCSFSHPERLDMKETDIGMDTACIALGVNDVADEIKASINEWQPDCALKTLTDGIFGDVVEGSYKGFVFLLYIGGYLDKDTGYSVKDIVQYLSSSFKIKNLELVKDEQGIEDKIAEAEGKKDPSGKGGKEKGNDLEI